MYFPKKSVTDRIGVSRALVDVYIPCPQKKWSFDLSSLNGCFFFFCEWFLSCWFQCQSVWGKKRNPKKSPRNWIDVESNARGEHLGNWKHWYSLSPCFATHTYPPHAGNGQCETDTKFMKYEYFWISEAAYSSLWSKQRAHISALLTFKWECGERGQVVNMTTMSSEQYVSSLFILLVLSHLTFDRRK